MRQLNCTSTQSINETHHCSGSGLQPLPRCVSTAPDDPHVRMMLRCWGAAGALTKRNTPLLPGAERQQGATGVVPADQQPLSSLGEPTGTSRYKAHTRERQKTHPPCVWSVVYKPRGNAGAAALMGWCGRNHTTPPHTHLPRRHCRPVPHPHTGLRGSSKAPPQPPTQRPCKHNLGCRRVAARQ
jgi:hypothetical protein